MNLFLTGPSVLEVFNTLLRHLRVSVDYKHSDPQRMNDEKNFQEAVINTIGKQKYDVAKIKKKRRK